MDRQNITKHCYRALIDQKFFDFPVCVQKFKMNDLHIISYSKYSKESGMDIKTLSAGYFMKDGFCLPNIKGKKLILYNDQMPKQRQNFTLAHEIGHIILDHGEQHDKFEKQADLFAAQFLVPDAVLYKLAMGDTKLSVQFISEAFGTSFKTAQIKMRTITRFGFIKTELDGAVQKKFSAFIRKNAMLLKEKDSYNNQKLADIENMLLEE